VWFRIKALPMEEVAFFVIQTLLVSLAMFVANGLLPNISGPQTIETRAPYLALACAILAAGTLVGIRVGVRSYGWHLLVWSVPLILAQWCIGWPLFIPRIQTLMLVTAVCSAYLIWTDVQAIKRGIWYFDHRKVGRRRFFGVLPWEEAMFFVLTSLLVAQSYVLLAPEHSR
jgi:lycopene cyclase domain-containing protein